MAKTTDMAALNQWYAVETAADLGVRPIRTRLLGQDIDLCRNDRGTPVICEVRDGTATGNPLPFRT